VKLTSDELKIWLRSAIASSVGAVCITASVIDLTTNITSPQRLLKAIESNPSFFEDGYYNAEHTNEKPQDNDDGITFSHYVFAVTLEVTLTNGPVTGGMRQLLSSLVGYEFIKRIKKENYGYLGYVLIRAPESPLELSELQELLNKYSIMYAFPDGTDSYNLNNVRLGNGIGSRA